MNTRLQVRCTVNPNHRRFAVGVMAVIDIEADENGNWIRDIDTTDRNDPTGDCCWACIDTNEDGTICNAEATATEAPIHHPVPDPITALYAQATEQGITVDDLLHIGQIPRDRIGTGGVYEVLEMLLKDDSPEWISEIMTVTFEHVKNRKQNV